MAAGSRLKIGFASSEILIIKNHPPQRHRAQGTG